MTFLNPFLLILRHNYNPFLLKFSGFNLGVRRHFTIRVLLFTEPRASTYLRVPCPSLISFEAKLTWTSLISVAHLTECPRPQIS